LPVTKWDYLTLSYTLSKHSDDTGSLGPFSEGALLDLWDHFCPNELEIIGAESHEAIHAGVAELHLIGLAHAIAEFVMNGYLVRDAVGSLWLTGPRPSITT
jgi:hypothetical protein